MCQNIENDFRFFFANCCLFFRCLVVTRETDVSLKQFQLELEDQNQNIKNARLSVLAKRTFQLCKTSRRQARAKSEGQRNTKVPVLQVRLLVGWRLRLKMMET